MLLNGKNRSNIVITLMIKKLLGVIVAANILTRNNKVTDVRRKPSASTRMR